MRVEHGQSVLLCGNEDQLLSLNDEGNLFSTVHDSLDKSSLRPAIRDEQSLE